MKQDRGEGVCSGTAGFLTRPFERVYGPPLAVLALTLVSYVATPYASDATAQVFPGPGLSALVCLCPYAIPLLGMWGLTRATGGRLSADGLGLSLGLKGWQRSFVIQFVVALTGFCVLILGLMAYLKLHGVDLHLLNPYCAGGEGPWTQLAGMDLALAVAPHIPTTLLIAPIVEEAFFTAFVYPSLRNGWGTVPALHVVSFLFAAHHPYADPFHGGQGAALAALMGVQILLDPLYPSLPVLPQPVSVGRPACLSERSCAVPGTLGPTMKGPSYSRDGEGGDDLQGAGRGRTASPRAHRT